LSSCVVLLGTPLGLPGPGLPSPILGVCFSVMASGAGLVTRERKTAHWIEQRTRLLVRSLSCFPSGYTCVLRLELSSCHTASEDRDDEYP
jgi:hypothetical protein